MDTGAFGSSGFKHLGPKQQAGFDDSEQREFSRALKQNLLVQTPLQVLLETMFARLQSQAQMFHDLHDRIEYLESKEAGSKELLLRMELCESRVEELAACSMPVSKQQELLSRLTAAEKQATTAMEQTVMECEALGNMVTDLESRVAEIEDSVSRMPAEASEVTEGQQEPALESEPSLASHAHAAEGEGLEAGASHMEGAEPHGHDAHAHASASGAHAASTRSQVPASKTAKGSAKSETRLVVIGHRKPAVRPREGRLSIGSGASGTSEGGYVPVSTSAALSDLVAKVQKLSEDNKALTTTVEDQTSSLNRMTSTLDDVRASTSGRIKALESNAQHMKAHLVDEVASVKAIVSSISAEPRVGIVEFTQLKNQVEVAVRGLQSSSEAFEELKDNDIRALNEAVEELQVSARRVDDTASSLMDTQQRLAAVESKIEEVRSELQVAMSDALEGVAHLTDLEELGKEIDLKATSHEIKQLAQQQAALAQSVNGMAEWLAVRPEPEGSKTGPPSLTKFRCLTCDQEMKASTQRASGTFAKAGLLPKLDGMNPPQSLVPGGPGLHVAEMRRMTTSPGHRHGSPPRGQDYADYGGMEGTRTQRSTRTTDGRVALTMPAGGLKLPPGPRAPVFIA